eukprot:CAMPEP_0204511176 /NCGR_PEP_ID=MMETSP0661-20131031/290_1 /ASSEMBLY_ACC=CAM_ASM_000606 /TAXON_ID=109239 /ORGANISM="Alexandrium margalefi, Strain AMGDE01CS-322" /LENGTH=36 /DNA_ID= /DNA_START= /DNA_END= /DNA_ORIENTATION=
MTSDPGPKPEDPGILSRPGGACISTCISWKVAGKPT